MPAVLQPNQSHFVSIRSTIQKSCVGFGVVSILIALAGVFSPGFLGMHMGFVHNSIYFVLGALGLWAGYRASSRNALNFCVVIGTVLFVLGFVGFVVGTPGYPGIGYMEADQNLFRIVPNAFELGTIDHIVHLVLGAYLLFAAYFWKREGSSISNSNSGFGGRA